MNARHEYIDEQLAMSTRFRADIEGLRALAIVPVLLFHLDSRLCPGGFIGVDIFFVISGFLISGMILDQGETFSFKTFYLRRVLRLFPALLVTLLATMIAAWKYLGPADFVQLAKEATAATFGVSNFYFLTTFDYFQPAGASQPLLHTWSLGLEEQVYLFWPMLLVFATGRAWLGTVLVAVGVASLLLVVIVQPHYAQAVFYLMPFRAFEFAIGAALVVGPSRIEDLPAWARTAGGAAAVAALIASMALFDGATPWPGVHALLPVFATAMLIAAGAQGLWQRVLSLAPLRFLGRISYSLYLVHWPLIVYNRGYSITDTGWVETLRLGGLSILLALLLYLLVETPFREADRKARLPAWLKLNDFGRGVRLGGVALLVFAVAGFASAALGTNGFPNRLDRARIQLLDKGLTFAGDVCDQRHARCTFGAKDADLVVYLIGDSHALNLVYGLDRLFRELNVRGVALYDHGCLFAFGSKRFINGVPDEVCSRNIQRTYDFLAGNTHPVILASDYGGYRNEIGPADASAPLRLDEGEYSAWVAERLEAGLMHIKAGERPFVLVKQTYTAGIDVPKCLAQPGVDDRNRSARCPALSLARVLEIYARTDAMIETLATRFPSITVIDPKSAVCEATTCAITAPDGSPYFRDSSHLTNEGSAFLVGKVREALQKALLR